LKFSKKKKILEKKPSTKTCNKPSKKKAGNKKRTLSFRFCYVRSDKERGNHPSLKPLPPLSLLSSNPKSTYRVFFFGGLKKPHLLFCLFFSEKKDYWSPVVSMQDSFTPALKDAKKEKKREE
jgi:hypothetical protein